MEIKTTPPLTTATLLIEDGLVRDEQTNEFCLPLTSTVILNRKQEMLYVPVGFENNLTVDALVDSGVFVSSIAQKDLDTLKEKAPQRTFLKLTIPQFSDKSSQWPVKQTFSNSHT